MKSDLDPSPPSNDKVIAAFERARSRAAEASVRVERRSERLLHRDVPTFAELAPVDPAECAGVDAVVYGIPFEGFVVKDPRTFYPQGTGPAPGSDLYSRPGAFEAPSAIRQASLFYSFDHSNGEMPEHGFVVGEEIELRDAGDAAIAGLEPEAVLNQTAPALRSIVEAGAVPLVLGGDHLVPLFPISAIHEVTGLKVGVLCFDSHLDLSWEPRYWAGSQWARAMEIGALDPAGLVQIGTRGTRNARSWVAAAEELGVAYYPMSDVEARGMEPIVAEALERVLENCDLLYLSIDVDCFDPAMVPSQKYPESGGMTTREVIAAVRQVMAGAPPLAGFDFCCLGPAYDHQHTGAAAAARCVLEVAAGIAVRKRAGLPNPLSVPTPPEK